MCSRLDFEWNSFSPDFLAMFVYIISCLNIANLETKVLLNSIMSLTQAPLLNSLFLFWPKQPTNQPTNQAAKQPSNQATKQPSNQATKQPSNQATKQPTNPI